MIDSPDRLRRLWDLLDREIAAYQLLLEEMKKEWECLTKDEVSALPSLLQAKAVHIHQIKEVRESVDEIISKLLVDSISPFPKTVLDLIPYLPVSQADRIKNYQRKRNGLGEQIVRINEKNKHFIQEVLSYLKGLFSLLTSPVLEGPVYVKDGRKISPPPLRSWMSKKV